MSKYGFNYFVSRSHLLQEMAPPTKLFGNSSTLNNWMIRVKELLKKGDLEELQKFDPSFDTSSEESQLYAKLGPGRTESSYKLAVVRAILETIQDIAPLQTIPVKGFPAKIQKMIKNILASKGITDVPIEFTEDDLKYDDFGSFLSIIADNTGMGDAVRSVFTQIGKEKEGKIAYAEIKRLMSAYSYAIDHNEDATPMTPKELVGHYTGKTEQDAYYKLIKILVAEGVFDNIDTDKLIKNTPLKKIYKYLLSTKETSNFSKGIDELVAGATGEYKDELRKKTYRILPKIRELNHKTKMFKFRGILPKGDVEVNQNEKGLDELPFDLEYIQSIVKILDKAYRLRESGDYVDTNAKTFDAAVSMYGQGYDFKISRIFLDALSPNDFLALRNMFSGIEKEFKVKKASYTAEDFEKNINELSQKMKNYKSAAQILNFLNAIKFFLNRIEPQSTESDDDVDTDTGEVDDETFPYPEYNPVLFYSVFKTPEEQELFDYWYNYKQKEQEAIKNRIRIKYTVKAGSDIQSKQNNPVNDEETEDQYAESYTGMYMTEQVERDKLFNPRGEFKDRGFRKPLNYWHWSQND